MNTQIEEQTAERPRDEHQWLRKVSAAYDDELMMLETQLTDPDTVFKQRVHVSGFEVDVENLDAVNEMRQRIVIEAEASRGVQATLAAAGITPIAILPADMFAKVVENAGLYTFKRMQRDGKVLGNGELFKRKISMEDNIFLFIFMYVAIIAPPIGLVVLCMSSYINCGPACLLFFLFALYCTIASGNRSIMADEKKGWFSRMVLKGFPYTHFLQLRIEEWNERRVRKNTKRILWKDRTDMSEECAFPVSISLPEPPPEIYQKLLKCHEHNISTFLIVAEDAFDVVMDKEALQKLRRLYPTDPIIAMEQDGMVAVIDQFGDFQGEQQVIQYVRDHFSAIRNDLFTVQKN